MKKVKTKVKETFHWIHDHLHDHHHSHDHLHVTNESRSRSSSTSSGYFHSTTSFPTTSTSSAFTEVFVGPNLQYKAESEGKQEQMTILEESVQGLEVGPELRMPVVVESSSTTEMANPDEPLSKSSVVALSALPPPIEISTPLLCQDPAFPMPTTVNAEPGDVQPGETEPHLEHTSVHVEQEVPDPLFKGEESKVMPTESKRETFVVPSLVLPDAPDAQKISLDFSSTNVSTADITVTSPTISEPLISSPPNVDKLPHKEPALLVRGGDEEVPDLFLPGLTARTLLSPIPNVRSFIFSSNLLFWWLQTSFLTYNMYDRRTR